MKFKTQALKEGTPEVLLAQAMELKWKGIMIIGIVDRPEMKNDILCFAQAGLNDKEAAWLLMRATTKIQNAMEINQREIE